jgi:hypothetical protein
MRMREKTMKRVNERKFNEPDESMNRVGVALISKHPRTRMEITLKMGRITL